MNIFDPMISVALLFTFVYLEFALGQNTTEERINFQSRQENCFYRRIFSARRQMFPSQIIHATRFVSTNLKLTLLAKAIINGNGLWFDVSESESESSCLARALVKLKDEPGWSKASRLTPVSGNLTRMWDARQRTPFYASRMDERSFFSPWSREGETG